MHKSKQIILLSLLVLALSGICAAASAENYSYDDFCAAFTLPKGVYSKMITDKNIDENLEFITSQGLNAEEIKDDFDQYGLRMIAFDTKNGRRFMLTAVQDTDAINYFDLNLQDDSMRKKFRTGHTDGTVYGKLGYSYSTASWKNYGGTVLRFLQTRYTLTENGNLLWYGAQRRTIRNGFTITLDMQVPGRKMNDDDVRALETIMKSFSFTKILDLPELPIQLTITSEPPQETHSDTFTVKGTTLEKANIDISCVNMSSTQSQLFTGTAKGNGKFSVNVKLPSRGVYIVTVTVSKEGSLDAQTSYSVSYDPTRIICGVTQIPPDNLEKETVIAGTTEAGVSTMLVVSGPVEIIKESSSRNFSFKVDTSLEGTYSFRLVMTRKGYNERIFEYSGTRAVTDEEKTAQMKKSAIKPEYSKLVKNSEGYDGRLFGYTGWITEIREGEEDLLYTIALAKNSKGYKNLIYVVTPLETAFSEGDKVKVYAEKNGDIVSIENGKSVSVPRFDLVLMEKAN